jgi:putative membrane protein insertion efficiency factor
MKTGVAEIALRGYKRFVSPALPASCRFVPTCSEYAAEAVTRYGWVRGGRMTLWRLLRCHPLARGGHDPVPVHDCSTKKDDLRGKLTTA